MLISSVVVNWKPSNCCGLHMDPLGLLFLLFILFLEALSDIVGFSNAAAKLIIRILHIIPGAVGVVVVLGVRHPRSLAEG